MWTDKGKEPERGQKDNFVAELGRKSKVNRYKMIIHPIVNGHVADV